MFVVMLPLAAVAVLAVFVYVAREQMGLEGIGLAALRTAGLGALIVLFLNPGRAVRVEGEPPLVLLDASLSMGAAGGPWPRALDTARVLAGTAGPVLRFGFGTARFDTAGPQDGRSRLASAIRVARAADRPVVVVTDGEIEDIESIAPTLLEGVSFVVLPRDTLPNASLVSVDGSPRVAREDSIHIGVAIGLWGVGQEHAARLEVFEADRRLASVDVTLPPAPSVARRRIALPPRTLSTGLHVLRVRVSTADDQEQRDDERHLLLTVSEQPPVVVIADPADWEGRFLASELGDIVHNAVRAYARVGENRWLDMKTLRPLESSAVMRAARGASLLVLRARRGPTLLQGSGAQQAVWHWPGGADDASEFFAGDWYLTQATTASPLAGRVASVHWDSLPPLSGLVPLVPGPREWVALGARQGRRGPERPVLIGKDSAGIRTLTTTGAGLWRWGFRGGAPREAYRTLLAAGSDWLLGSNALRRQIPLSSSPTVGRGEPVVFRRSGDAVPDSIEIRLSREGAADTTVALWFASDSLALYHGPPGVYRWAAVGNPRLSGVSVIEEYSAEYQPRRVWIPEGDGGTIVRLVQRYAREYWWLFVFAVVAFAGEWAWRYRRGLP